MDDSCVQSRSAAERRLAVSAHLCGVLGITAVGWAVAAAWSASLLLRAKRSRSPYLAAQARQAAAFQLAVLAIDAVAAVWLVAGFTSFVDQIPGLPRLRLDYAGEAPATVLAIAWALSIVLVLFWHVGTVILAVIAARRTAKECAFSYPLLRRWLGGS